MRKPAESTGPLRTSLGHHFIPLKNTGEESGFDPAFLGQIVLEDNQKADERKLLIMKKSQLINAKGIKN